MDKSQIKILKELLDKAVWAPTKNQAKPILRRLRSEASQLSDELTPYLEEKLSDAISYASEASGRVNDKEHWKKSMKTSWYLFENGFENNKKD